MVAIGRGLMSRPHLLLLDEPSLGLAPLLVKELMGTLAKLKEQELTILLSEQNAEAALSIADRGYGMGGGGSLLKEQVKSFVLRKGSRRRVWADSLTILDDEN